MASLKSHTSTSHVVNNTGTDSLLLLAASSFPSSSFSFLVMMVVDLPPQKTPPKDHVPLPLSPKLLAWIKAHPDVWPMYKAYAHACTKSQELEKLFKQLDHWSATRSKEGELECVVEEYSGFLKEAEEQVKDLTPGEEKAARFMKALGALWTSSTLKIAKKWSQKTELASAYHGSASAYHGSARAYHGSASAYHGSKNCF